MPSPPTVQLSSRTPFANVALLQRQISLSLSPELSLSRRCARALSLFSLRAIRTRIVLRQLRLSVILPRSHLDLTRSNQNGKSLCPSRYSNPFTVVRILDLSRMSLLNSIWTSISLVLVYDCHAIAFFCACIWMLCLELSVWDLNWLEI